MLSSRIQLIPALVAVLAIAAALLLSGCCAQAADADQSVDHAAAQQQAYEHDHHHTQHCDPLCSNGSECGDSTNRIGAAAAAVGSTDELHELEGPDFWWSPQLVATLWLVDRLAEATTPTTPPGSPPPTLAADRSNTYLTLSTLLI